jgi:hypothetical protein
MDARRLWEAGRRAWNHVVVPVWGSRGDYGWFGVAVAWGGSMHRDAVALTRERGHGVGMRWGAWAGSMEGFRARLGVAPLRRNRLDWEGGLREGRAALAVHVLWTCGALKRRGGIFSSSLRFYRPRFLHRGKQILIDSLAWKSCKK